MHIKLSNSVSLTTETSASSHGVPVLIISDEVFGCGDDYRAALIEAMKRNDGMDFILETYSSSQLISGLCEQYDGREGDAMKSFRLFEGRTFHSAMLGWVRPEEAVCRI